MGLPNIEADARRYNWLGCHVASRPGLRRAAGDAPE